MIIMMKSLKNAVTNQYANYRAMHCKLVHSAVKRSNAGSVETSSN